MLRWLILALRHDTNLILLSQSLHAFTFGGLFLASMKLMHDIMPEHLRDRGQAYIQAVGLGLGCLAGQWYFGFQAEQLNSYQEIPQLYLQSAAFTFIALLLSLILNKMLLKTCYSNTEISQ